MADEVVGSVQVDIKGDLSDLQAKLAEAASIAGNSGKLIAESLVGAFGGVGNLLTVGVTAPILGIGAAAVTAGTQINEALDTIRARTGETGEAFDQLATDFREVFSNVPDKAKDVAEAIAGIHDKTELVGEPLQTLTQKLVDLARIMGEDIPGVSESATEALNKWNIEAGNMETKLDAVMRAAQETGTPVRDLLEHVKQYAAPMQAFGLSFETALGFVGQFSEEGVNLGTVMQGLKTALKEMTEAGIQPSEQALIDIITQIKNTKDETEAYRLTVELFGQKAGAEMFTVIRNGKLDFQELTNTIRDGKDTIANATKDTDGFSEAWGKFRNEVTLVLEPLGVSLLNAATAALEAAKPLLEVVKDLADWFAKLPAPIQDGILILGGVAAAAGPAIKAYETISGLLGSLIEVLPAATGGMIATGEAATGAAGGLSAFGAAAGTLGLVGLAAGFAAVALNVGGLAEKIGDLLDKSIGEGGLFNWLMDLSSKALPGAAAGLLALKAAVDTINPPVSEAVKHAREYSEQLVDKTVKTKDATTATGAHVGIQRDIAAALEAGKTKWTEYGGELVKATRQLEDVDPLVRMLVDDMKAAESDHRKWIQAVADTSRELGHLATTAETVNRLNDQMLPKVQALIDTFKDFNGDFIKNLNADLKQAATDLKAFTDIPLTPTQEAIRDLGLRFVDVKANVDLAFQSLDKLLNDPSVSPLLLEQAFDAASEAVIDLAHVDLPAAMQAYEDLITKMDGVVSKGQELGLQREMLIGIITELKNAGLASDDWEIKLNDVNREIEDLRNNNGVWGAIRVEIDKTKDSTGALVRALAEDLAAAWDGVWRKSTETLADILVEGGKFKDGMIGYFKDIAKTIIEDLLNLALNPLKSALTDLITGNFSFSKLGADISAAIGGLRGLGQEAVATASTMGNAGSAIDAARTAAAGLDPALRGATEGANAAKTAAGPTGLAGTLGSATSAVTGWMSAIGGVVGAIGSIGSFIQGFRQEGTLNVIELNTRETAIHMKAFINQAFHDMLGAIRDWGEYSTGHLNYIRMFTEDIAAKLGTLITLSGGEQRAAAQRGEYELPDTEGMTSTGLLSEIHNRLAELVNLAGWQLKDLDIIAEAAMSGFGSGDGTAVGAGRTPRTPATGTGSSGSTASGPSFATVEKSAIDANISAFNARDAVDKQIAELKVLGQNVHDMAAPLESIDESIAAAEEAVAAWLEQGDQIAHDIALENLNNLKAAKAQQEAYLAEAIAAYNEGARKLGELQKQAEQSGLKAEAANDALKNFSGQTAKNTSDTKDSSQQTATNTKQTVTATTEAALETAAARKKLEELERTEIQLTKELADANAAGNTELATKLGNHLDHVRMEISKLGAFIDASSKRSAEEIKEEVAKAKAELEHLRLTEIALTKQINEANEAGNQALADKLGNDLDAVRMEAAKLGMFIETANKSLESTVSSSSDRVVSSQQQSAATISSAVMAGASAMSTAVSTTVAAAFQATAAVIQQGIGSLQAFAQSFAGGNFSASPMATGGGAQAQASNGGWAQDPRSFFGQDIPAYYQQALEQAKAAGHSVPMNMAQGGPQGAHVRMVNPDGTIVTIFDLANPFQMGLGSDSLRGMGYNLEDYASKGLYPSSEHFVAPSKEAFDEWLRANGFEAFVSNYKALVGTTIDQAKNSFGGFAEGGMIPFDMRAMVHQGELVIPADLTKQILQLPRVPNVGVPSAPAAAMGASMTIGNLNVTLPNVRNAQDFFREMQKFYTRLTPKALPQSA